MIVAHLRAFMLLNHPVFFTDDELLPRAICKPQQRPKAFAIP
jgi:hypothetical protein